MPPSILATRPADLVLLSFSDADLGAAAWPGSGWTRAGRAAPRQPRATCAIRSRSISTSSRCSQTRASVMVRLLGGLDYWRYGGEELLSLCRAAGNTAGAAARRWTGGWPAAERIVHRVACRAGRARPLSPPRRAGEFANRRCAWRGRCRAGVGNGATRPPVATPACWRARAPRQRAPDEDAPLRGRCVLPLASARRRHRARSKRWRRRLRLRGMRVRALYVASLKSAAGRVRGGAAPANGGPSVVLNATGVFRPSGRRAGLAARRSGAPVLQLILAGVDARRRGRHRRAACRPTDHGDAGRAAGTRWPALNQRHCLQDAGRAGRRAGILADGPSARPAQIAFVADRAARLGAAGAQPRRRQRRIAVVLSDYPGAARRRARSAMPSA